jgi:hypothetical protein
MTDDRHVPARNFPAFPTYNIRRFPDFVHAPTPFPSQQAIGTSVPPWDRELSRNFAQTKHFWHRDSNSTMPTWTSATGGDAHPMSTRPRDDAGTEHFEVLGQREDTRRESAKKARAATDPPAITDRTHLQSGSPAYDFSSIIFEPSRTLICRLSAAPVVVVVVDRPGQLDELRAKFAGPLAGSNLIFVEPRMKHGSARIRLR